MAAPVAHGNVTLLVSNQSFDHTPVDITVTIDGAAIVRDEFAVAGDQPPQHNWRRYLLTLSDGPHSCVATSARGRARARATLDVAGHQTVYIAYWHGRQPGERGLPRGYFTIEGGSHRAATM